MKNFDLETQRLTWRLTQRLGKVTEKDGTRSLNFCEGEWCGDDDDEVMLNVLGCQMTYQGQTETNAEAWFNKSLRPRKPEGSLGRTAQDGHLDSHTAPEL